MSWGHYYEILKIDDEFERNFYIKQCELERWNVRELKRGDIKHDDIGQMNFYINYFRNEVCQPDDNPPIGIVLGARKDDLVMKYAMEGISNQLLAGKYQLYLPKREELQQRLDLLLDQADRNNIKADE